MIVPELALQVGTLGRLRGPVRLPDFPLIDDWIELVSEFDLA